MIHANLLILRTHSSIVKMINNIFNQFESEDVNQENPSENQIKYLAGSRVFSSFGSQRFKTFKSIRSSKKILELRGNGILLSVSLCSN